MPVHAFLKGGHAVLMVQKHEKSPFLADVRQPPPGRKYILHAEAVIKLALMGLKLWARGLQPSEHAFDLM